VLHDFHDAGHIFRHVFVYADFPEATVDVVVGGVSDGEGKCCVLDGHARDLFVERKQEVKERNVCINYLHNPVLSFL
jgi:hypothetical protein